MVYDICNLIGEGITSQVHLAVRKRDGLHFACKVIDKTKLRGKSVLAQLRKEVQILKLLDHPNIIKLESVTETMTHIYNILEFVDGCELFEYMYLRGALSQDMTSHVIHEVLDAVAFLHSCDVIHRDIKAENILVTPRPGCDITDRPMVKLIDFGFATILNHRSPTRQFLGTAGYLAPEMLQSRCYSKPVDIWAVGVLAYMLVTCRLPFDRDIESLPKCHSIVLERSYFCLTFDEPVWSSGLYEDMKDLLRGMLAVEPAARMNANECLRHPWTRRKLKFITPITPSVALPPSLQCHSSHGRLATIAQLSCDAPVVPHWTCNAIASTSFITPSLCHIKCDTSYKDKIVDDIECKARTTPVASPTSPRTTTLTTLPNPSPHLICTSSPAVTAV